MLVADSKPFNETSLIVADLHLEIGKSLCIVQIPGSIHLHTQFTMKYHNIVSIITRMIQVLRKIFDYNFA